MDNYKYYVKTSCEKAKYYASSTGKKKLRSYYDNII